MRKIASGVLRSLRLSRLVAFVNNSVWELLVVCGFG